MTMTLKSATIKRRQCATKTRTGCQTCKIRRVKCGEERPSCVRCTSTGRRCDGYSQDLRAPKTDDTAVVAVIQRLSIHAPGNAREKRGFEYFATTTASELTGFYDPNFWEQLVLQASSADPSLRHAVIAIGSLHEEFANKRLSYYKDNDVHAETFAINQYAKAIGHLRRSLSSGKQAPLTALMSCILFVCFDSLRGFFDSAMVHLRSGLKILKDIRTRCCDENHLILTQIAPLFKRLSLQAILYIDTRSTPARRAIVKDLEDVAGKEDEIPQQFQSLAEARHCMIQAADGLFRGFYLCDGEQPMSNQPIEAFEMYDRYTSQLHAWNIAFEGFMNAHSHTLTGRELRGAALLKIHQTTAQIMANIKPDFTDPRSTGTVFNDQERFELYKNEFKIITDLCSSLVAAAEQDVEKGKPGLTFSTDLGVIGPLYYTCVRCQDTDIRSQAIELLRRYPRREGMWDSEAGVKLVSEFWEIEKCHKELQVAGEGETGIDISLSDTVDLVFNNEMKWEWKWKAHLDDSSSDASSASSASSASRSSTPSNDWTTCWRMKGAYLKNSGDLYMKNTRNPYMKSTGNPSDRGFHLQNFQADSPSPSPGFC